jgi:DNA-binding NarL/FixJ family response regulator
LLEAGRAALARGAWAEARHVLEKSLSLEESAEALEAFALACWWLDQDLPRMFECRERAFRLYRAAHDLRSAARVATALGMDAVDLRGEMAVATGWLQRASSLLEAVEPSPEHGWLALYQGVLAMNEDLDLAREHQRSALDWAHKLSIFDLEMVATALDGLILVREGRVAEGMRRIDEVTTAATSGEMESLVAIGNACCAVIYACQAVADYDRAVQWCDRAAEFMRRWGWDTLFVTCRTSYGTVLVWRCAWPEAEAELTATQAYAGSRPTNALESLARLGDLRRRQGRHGEAEELLRRAEAHHMSLLGKAALALDKNDPASSLDLVRRFLRRIGDEDPAEHVFALEIAVRARIALGDIEAAEQRAGEAVAVAETVGTSSVRASAALSAGLYLAAAGGLEAARDNFEDAIDLFLATGNVFDGSRCRLDLAKVLARLGRDEAAMEQARSALQCFQRLGATYHATLAARIVRGDDGRLAFRAPVTFPGLTVRETEVLLLLSAGKTNQEIADELVLSVRTVERHISTIYEKINVHGKAARAAATAFALHHSSSSN